MSDAYTVLLVGADRSLARFCMARHRTRGWELPGGRIEPGEDVLTAARREWTEETGLPLDVIRPLLVHDRPDGSVGHLLVGAAWALHDVPAWARGGIERVGPDDMIETVRFVERLVDIAPLAFPDDPYDALAAATWDTARRLGWPIDDVDATAFCGRLAEHPEAHPRGDAVAPHPLSDQG